MNDNRTFTRVFRWSILIAGALGIWIAVRWLTGNLIPTTNEIMLGFDWHITLPFYVSRAWDFLAIPIWVYAWGYWINHPVFLGKDKTFFAAMEFIAWWFTVCTIVVVLFQGILSALATAIVILLAITATSILLWVAWLLIIWALD